MSKNDSSHIDKLADSVGFDTCQYSWIVRVLKMEYHQKWNGTQNRMALKIECHSKWNGT